MDSQSNTKDYLKKTLIFLGLILVLIAVAALFDFLGKTSEPSGTATLTWNANSEPDLAGYKIYYGTVPRTEDCPPGGYPNKVDVGKVTSYTINQLVKGQKYYFSITSYDTSQNESCFSEEGNKTVLNN